MDPDLRVGLVAQKCQKSDDNSEITLYSISYFSVTIGFTSAINVFIDSFRSAEGSSNWTFSIFAQSTEFSWKAKNAETATVIVIRSILKFLIFQHSSEM